MDPEEGWSISDRPSRTKRRVSGCQTEKESEEKTKALKIMRDATEEVSAQMIELEKRSEPKSDPDNYKQFEQLVKQARALSSINCFDGSIAVYKDALELRKNYISDNDTAAQEELKKVEREMIRMSSFNTGTLQRLPDELIIHILSFLPQQDRFRARLICPRFRELSFAPSLMKHIIISDLFKDPERFITFLNKKRFCFTSAHIEISGSRLMWSSLTSQPQPQLFMFLTSLSLKGDGLHYPNIGSGNLKLLVYFLHKCSQLKHLQVEDSTALAPFLSLAINLETLYVTNIQVLVSFNIDHRITGINPPYNIIHCLDNPEILRNRVSKVSFYDPVDRTRNQSYDPQQNYIFELFWLCQFHSRKFHINSWKCTQDDIIDKYIESYLNHEPGSHPTTKIKLSALSSLEFHGSVAGTFHPSMNAPNLRSLWYAYDKNSPRHYSSPQRFYQLCEETPNLKHLHVPGLLNSIEIFQFIQHIENWPLIESLCISFADSLSIDQLKLILSKLPKLRHLCLIDWDPPELSEVGVDEIFDNDYICGAICNSRGYHLNYVNINNRTDSVHNNNLKPDWCNCTQITSSDYVKPGPPNQLESF